MRHQILAADWLEHKGKWRVKIMQDNDPSKIIYDEAEFLINGGGALNEWTWPDIAGLRDFKGPVVHSAAFNHDVDLRGKRVGVIGIGSSAVQLVPAIAERVEKLYLFNVRFRSSQHWDTRWSPEVEIDRLAALTNMDRSWVRL